MPTRDRLMAPVPGRKIAPQPYAALIALTIFCALNALLWQFFAVEKHPVRGIGVDTARDNMWSGTGSVDVAVDEYAALPQRPTVVLLGSSLMMNTFWLMDRLVNPSLPDVFHYRGSFTLERQLAASGLPEQRVFNLASAGQMISDSYIWANEFLQGEKKPKVVILGIAPRDFYDADLPAIMATMTFKRLVGLENFDRYAPVFLPRWQDKVDFVAAHTCYFYGMRWRLQHETVRAMRQLCMASGLSPRQAKPPSLTDDTQLRQAGFLLEALDAQRWSNSLKEYRGRYHNIDKQDLSVQMGFLGKLLNLCHDRGIKVVLVNMPLSRENRALMPAGFYQQFRARINSIVEQRTAVQYIDLGDANGFGRPDYWDTVHLNDQGGHKLIEQLKAAVVAAARS